MVMLASYYGATNFQFMNNNGSSSWLKIESTQLTGPSAIGLSGLDRNSHNLNLLPGDGGGNINIGESGGDQIRFRGNSGSDSYRFAKSGQTAIEGFLSFESLTNDRTYTFPNSSGTIAYFQYC